MDKKLMKCDSDDYVAAIAARQVDIGSCPDALWVAEAREVASADHIITTSKLSVEREAARKKRTVIMSRFKSFKADAVARDAQSARELLATDTSKDRYPGRDVALMHACALASMELALATQCDEESEAVVLGLVKKLLVDSA